MSFRAASSRQVILKVITFQIKLKSEEMEVSMDIEQLVFLEPTEFKIILLNNSHSFHPVDIYNALTQRGIEEPECRVYVNALAEAAVEVFTSLDEIDEVLLFLEFQTRYHLTEGDFDKAIEIIHCMTALDSTTAETTVLELIQEISESIDGFGVSIDQRAKVLRQIQLVLQHYDRQEDIVELYLRSAIVCSQHGASQAAYRCINDAEEIAHALQSLPFLARCYSVAVIVACEEPDFRWAIGVGEQALDIYRSIELEVPANLFSNLGVAHMNLDETTLAISYFNRALACSDTSVTGEVGIRVNLSTCLRRDNQLLQAENMLMAAEAIGGLEDHPEQALELALSAAKLAIAKGDISSLTQRLQIASKKLDHLLSYALRLHYRRGVRERYITRFEALLRSLPASGPAESSLLPIVSTRGNSMGDWLAILSWGDQLLQESSFPSVLAEQLINILNRIRNIGAPHLYGFREKYDDPWGVFNSVEVWDELSQLCRKIKELGFSLPLDRANSQNQYELCQLRLAQGHCIMVTTYAGEDALLWYFIDRQYYRVSLPLTPMKQWYQAQLNYANGSISRSDFCRAMAELTQELSPLLEPVFTTIAMAECDSIRYIDDSLRILPLLLFVRQNASLSKRMKVGAFHIRIVPAMVEPLSEDIPLTGVASIIDLDEDLLLPPYEAQVFTRAAGLPQAETISADSEDCLTSLIGKRDILIVSTHGHALTSYTDAYFAHLGGTPDESHLISVSSLQAEAPDLQLRLVILSTCYSGTQSSRNYQKHFRTSDAVAIPNLFLLNRRAVAFASTWKISDTASFIIAHLIGEGLRAGYEPSAALASAIARLPSMTRSETIAILTDGLPRKAQAEAIRRLDGAPEQGMFSHDYFTTGFTIHGLL